MSNDLPKEKGLLAQHYRWLVDNKLKYFESFENRRGQILGLNGVFLSLLWGTWQESSSIATMEWLFLFLYILALLGQIPFYLLLSSPRKARIPLQLLDSIDLTIENLVSYFKQISQYLGETAGRTRWIYKLFGLQVGSLMGLFVFRVLR